MKRSLRVIALPLIATRYYGTRHKTQRAALAQHYLGCAYKDMGRDIEAIDAMLRATTLFIQVYTEMKVLLIIVVIILERIIIEC